MGNRVPAIVAQAGGQFGGDGWPQPIDQPRKRVSGSSGPESWIQAARMACTADLDALRPPINMPRAPGWIRTFTQPQSAANVVLHLHRRQLAMLVARLARASDLPSLLSLFDASEESVVAQPRERAESIWREILAQQGVRVFVSDDRDRIATTSCLSPHRTDRFDPTVDPSRRGPRRAPL
jgi:hypothetical protein